jgi:hypothetical protein
MKAFFRWPFYPFLFAAYPIAFMATYNLSVIPPLDILRPLLIAEAAAAFLLCYFKLVLKDWHRSALTDLLVVALFFSFGHAADRIGVMSQGTLLGIWLIVFMGLSFLVTRLRKVETTTLILNFFSICLLGMALVPMAGFFLHRVRIRQESERFSNLLAMERGERQAEKGAVTPARPPDIYYIILDSYEGISGLRRYYHFDNTDFVRELQERGFYVAAESRSNYLTTTYSLASTLNLVYLNDLPYDLFTEMVSSLRIDHVADFLRGRGYQYVQCPSGYFLTDDADPDVWISPWLRAQQSAFSQPTASEFEIMLLQTTLARVIVQSSRSAIFDREFDDRRLRLENCFTHLPDYAADGRGNFLFLHLILPHNPYLYNAAGVPYSFNGRTELFGDQADPQNNIRLYLDQLIYTNARVLDAIDRILERADTPPIIILQGDHGHDTFFDFENPTPEGVDLRSSILNVMFFPDGDYRLLYPSISPVNTFRVVFNRFFGTKYPLLQDVGYVHPRRTPNSLNSLQLFSPIGPYLEGLPQPDH